MRASAFRVFCRASFLCAAAFVCLPHALSQAQGDQLQSTYRDGIAAMKAGHPDQAEQLFRRTTEMDASFAPGFLDLGLAQLREGKLPDAIASLNKALDLDANAPGADLFLGIAYYQTNHADEAVVHLQKAIAANPNSVEANLWMGIVELSTGHPELATAPLDHAAELSPKDENILDYRGQAHMQVARASYATLYQLDPGSWRVHRLKAQIADEGEHQQQAIDEFLAAIKLAPKQADLYEELGDEYRKTGATELAEKAYAQQLELTPGNPVAMYNLGSIRVDRGEEKTGVPLLEQVVKLYGHPTVADYYLGRGLATEGENAQAEAALKRATQVEGEVQRRAWYELGQLYRKTNQPEQARAALEQYQSLRQANDRETARKEEDWRRLNASGGNALASQP
ncbi:tetratricopeptide repeat protein [Silvibacterium sp.]|uniref:tetratricopeptide repeat protein n=1 Tax=Silvibacterium sp. TaxID=1964179 RepID=UPI0039E6357F